MPYATSGSNRNIIIQFFIIYVPSQHPHGEEDGEEEAEEEKEEEESNG
jgi:hypothetical protein